jgi:carbonic anhydrase
VSASHPLAQLLEKNAAWAKRVRAQQPDFFERLAREQSPQYLWIGCSDSRVPANEIVDMRPGEIFVHRNIANLVVHTDLNCLSVLQFAVDVLRIQHVIVCGHYRCSGIQAALESERHGLVDNWLRHVQDVRDKYVTELNALSKPQARAERLCELNVAEQVRNVARTDTVVNAWAIGRPLAIHGVVYDVADGLLRDLKVTMTGSR